VGECSRSDPRKLQEERGRGQEWIQRLETGGVSRTEEAAAKAISEGEPDLSLESRTSATEPVWERETLDLI
jgi:hypothetical protein